MPYFKISLDIFPELKGSLTRFRKFMRKEFATYLRSDNSFYAHNESDAGWFTKQYLDAKAGKGLYQDFFKTT